MFVPQEQVRSGDASATELFELGAVMLRRKFYPAATKFLLQAIEKWDGDDQDLAQVLISRHLLMVVILCIVYCLASLLMTISVQSQSREAYTLDHYVCSLYDYNCLGLIFKNIFTGLQCSWRQLHP